MQLLDLPPEILLEILDIGNFSTEVLKSLRLVDPIFRQSVIPLLFKTITLPFSAFKAVKGIKSKLGRVARRIQNGELERIRDYVRNLVITGRGSQCEFENLSAASAKMVLNGLFPGLVSLHLDLNCNYAAGSAVRKFLILVGENVDSKISLHVKIIGATPGVVGKIPSHVESLDLQHQPGGSFDEGRLGSKLGPAIAAVARNAHPPRLSSLRLAGSGCRFAVARLCHNFASGNNWIVTENPLSKVRRFELSNRKPSEGDNEDCDGRIVGWLPNLTELVLDQRARHTAGQPWESLLVADHKLTVIRARQISPRMLQYVASTAGAHLRVLHLDLFIPARFRDPSDVFMRYDFTDDVQLATQLWLKVVPMVQSHLGVLCVNVIDPEVSPNFSYRHGNFSENLSTETPQHPWSILAHVNDATYNFPRLTKFSGVISWQEGQFGSIMDILEHTCPKIRGIALVVGALCQFLTVESRAPIFQAIFEEAEACQHGDRNFHRSTELDLDILIRPQKIGNTGRFQHKGKEYSFGALGWEARRH